MLFINNAVLWHNFKKAKILFAHLKTSMFGPL